MLKESACFSKVASFRSTNSADEKQKAHSTNHSHQRTLPSGPLSLAGSGRELSGELLCPGHAADGSQEPTIILTHYSHFSPEPPLGFTVPNWVVFAKRTCAGFHPSPSRFYQLISSHGLISNCASAQLVSQILSTLPSKCLIVVSFCRSANKANCRRIELDFRQLPMVMITIGRPRFLLPKRITCRVVESTRRSCAKIFKPANIIDRLVAFTSLDHYKF